MTTFGWVNIVAAMVNELIDALGGNTRVGRMLGVAPSAVSNWRLFGAIPPRWAIPMQRLCRTKNVPLDETVFRAMRRDERLAAASEGR